MKKVCTALQKVEYGLCGILLAGMVAVIFLATFARFSKLFTTPWAEELARYMMIWLGFVGAGAVARTGTHFGVDVLVKKLSDRRKIIMYIIQIVAITAICIWIFYYGIRICITQVTMNRTSPSMKLPMYLVSICVPYTAISVGLQNFLYEIDVIRRLQRKKEQTPEEGE